MVKRKVIQKEPFDEIHSSSFSNQSEDLKSQDYSDKEIINFFSPARSNIQFLNTFDCIFLTIIFITVFIHVLTYCDFLSWQLSSLGRILMIKFLPIYDWRHLKNKQCLIDKPDVNSNLGTSVVFNCDLCENIKKIDVYDNLDDDLLEEKYIEIDVPVIFTKGLEFWPRNLKFLDDLTVDQNFASSYPCKFSSSSSKGFSTTGDILKKLRRFNNFFVHFQNCDQDAMRALRRFTYRPDRLPANYSPVTYNWLIWNKNYNATNYKSIDLIEKLTLYGQIIGSSYVRLIPRNNCENMCSVLETKLFEGEILIFTSLWDLEYKPNEIGENAAVILEARD